MLYLKGFSAKCNPFKIIIFLVITAGVSRGSLFGRAVPSTQYKPLTRNSHDYESPKNSFISTESDRNAKNFDGSSARGVGEIFVPKTFPLGSEEPTCEQLRTMWIFSKRQSRAAEISNEIPTYRDPFSYNIWQPYNLNAKHYGSSRTSAREKLRSPVFGRIVSREPLFQYRLAYGQKQSRFGSDGGGLPRFFGTDSRPLKNGILRRPTQNRNIGSRNSSSANGRINQYSINGKGSFQKLKELIWTERSKDLHKQRSAEEIAARVAVLREITNGQIANPSYKPATIHKLESSLMSENFSPDNNNDNPYINDERNTIAREQSQQSAAKSSSTNKMKHTLHRHTNRIGYRTGKNIRKNSIFSKFSQDFPVRRTKDLPTNDFHSTYFKGQKQNLIETPRNYPMWQSHFRERNRSLKNPNVLDDFLHRNTRNFKNKDIYSPNNKLQYILAINNYKKLTEFANIIDSLNLILELEKLENNNNMEYLDQNVNQYKISQLQLPYQYDNMIID